MSSRSACQLAIGTVAVRAMMEDTRDKGSLSVTREGLVARAAVVGAGKKDQVVLGVGWW